MTVPQTTSATDDPPGSVVVINANRWRAGIGAVALLMFIGYLIEAFKLPMGTPQSPGAGLFPVGIGIGGILVSIIVIIEAVRAPAETETLPKGPEARHVLFFTGTLVLAILLLPWLGMYVTATLYTAGVAWYLGERPRWRGAVIGAVVALAATAVFIELLEVRLPRGIW